MTEYHNSPEDQVRSIWKDIRNCDVQIEKWLADEDRIENIVYTLNDKKERGGRLINAILDYYFPKSLDTAIEDMKYVRENKYKLKEEENI